MKNAWAVICNEPYRLFFPIGIGMWVFGASHWLLYALGIIPNYSGSFHSAVQIQLYMSSFVVGFLTTAVPRFSATFTAESFEVTAFLALILAIFAGVVSGHPLLAHGFFMALVVGLLVFVARRFLKRNIQYPPVQFIWIPVAALHGVCGSALMILAQKGVLGVNFMASAKPMLNQGFMLSLVLGIGGFLGPRIMGSREFPNPESIRASIPAFRSRQAVIQGVAGLIFFSSFWLEGLDFKTAAYALRAAAATYILLQSHALILRPKTPGVFSRLVWMSFWFIVAGLWLALFFPKHLVSALHLVFIGGFSLITFAVSTMVVYSHSGQGEKLQRSPWILKLVMVLVPLALFFRLTAALTTEHYFTGLGIAAFLWIVAGVSWFIFAANFFIKIPQRSHEERGGGC